MRKIRGFPLGTAGALALLLASLNGVSAGIFRGPYDYSYGPYRGGHNWSYAESYGYYGVANLSAYANYVYPSGGFGYGYYPLGWGLGYPYRYGFYNVINPAYTVPPRPPGYSIKAMAKDVVLPPVNEINGLAAVIEVKMPCYGDLWVDGAPTEQLGTDRLFTSPPLEKGSEYVYLLRARWVQDGKTIEQSREVRVHGGERVRVVFPASEKP
jgi:uncharacterized protein (TIGR03000 family)